MIRIVRFDCVYTCERWLDLSLFDCLQVIRAASLPMSYLVAVVALCLLRVTAGLSGINFGPTRRGTILGFNLAIVLRRSLPLLSLSLKIAKRGAARELGVGATDLSLKLLSAALKRPWSLLRVTSSLFMW